MNKIVKTNVYRCLKHCPNCPFLDNGKAMHLHDGRVHELEQMLINEENSSFNCHKTVYNLDNDMNGSKEQPLKMCYGAYLVKKKAGVENLQMKLAKHLGLEKD